MTRAPWKAWYKWWFSILCRESIALNHRTCKQLLTPLAHCFTKLSFSPPFRLTFLTLPPTLYHTQTPSPHAYNYRAVKWQPTRSSAPHGHAKHLKSIVAFRQVAALEKQFPGTVKCGYMSYLEDTPNPSPSSAAADSGTLSAPAISGPAECALNPVASGGSSQPLDVLVPSITFLFKLTAGVAPRSFGLNVAKMAHLPDGVVERAAVKAAEMEQQMKLRKSASVGAESDL